MKINSKETYSRIKHFLRDCFDMSPDKENEKKVIASIYSGIEFRGANLWVLIFAIFIASLGLNVNSTAVIIGAMLISPLMGPIIGMGMAAGINDIYMLRRSFRNYLIATVISVLTATLYFMISPLSEAQSELLARTAPTLYDVLIAFFGGAAGIVALSTKGENNVLPGVAIATALMPPLCTAGFGLAYGDAHFFFGAFYLYLINTVFITLSTWLIVKLMRFHPKEELTESRARQTRRFMTTLILLTMIPAAIVTVKTIQSSVFESNVGKFIKNELTQQGIQIISNSVDNENKVLNVITYGKEIAGPKQEEIRGQLKKYGLEKYELNLIQVSQTDSLLSLNKQLSQLQIDEQKIVELSSETNRLAQQLNEYKSLEQMTNDIGEEMKTLFPKIGTISLSMGNEKNCQLGESQRVIMAVVGMNKGNKMTTEEEQRLQSWLRTRLKTEEIRLVVETK